MLQSSKCEKKSRGACDYDKNKYCSYHCYVWWMYWCVISEGEIEMYEKYSSLMNGYCEKGAVWSPCADGSKISNGIQWLELWCDIDVVIAIAHIILYYVTSFYLYTYVIISYVLKGKPLKMY